MSVDALRQSALAHKRKLNNQEQRQRLELDMNKQAHDANLEELRKSKSQDAVNVDTQHHRQIAEKTFEKEKKLEQLRMSMEDAQKVTDQEIQRQQELHKKTTTDRNENYQRNLQTSREQQELTLEDMNHRYNVAAREAHNTQLSQTAQQEARFQHQDGVQRQHWSAKINENRNKFAETFQAEGQKFEHLKRMQHSNYEKDLKKNHVQNETKLAEQNKRHVKHEKQLAEQNNKSLQDQEVMFEKKYQAQLGRHTASEQNLEDINKKVVERSKEDMIKRVKVYENRSNDPFFHFTQLKPEVTEQPDHYVVKMKVPEYAKEEVILSTNTREIVVTFNRRHKEERTDEDGSRLKFDKVESTVSRVPVAHILSTKKITKEWADGVLTYKIAKA